MDHVVAVVVAVESVEAAAVVEVVVVVVISQPASEVLVECLYPMIFNGTIPTDFHLNF